jgi:hypothetical protein
LCETMMISSEWISRKMKEESSGLIFLSTALGSQLVHFP